MTTTFAHLGLSKPLRRALADGGITEPFPIQAVAIPDALTGRDLSAKAPTGSGKTLAFGLPVLATVARAESRRPRALILAPTRELAEQITQELRPLAGAVDRRILAVYGGVAYGSQKGPLRKGIDVLVATPGRLEDLIDQGAVALDQVDIVVIDEADRMADMGFMPAVRRLLDHTSPARQTLLFSATLDGDVAELSRNYQRNPVSHEAAAVTPETTDASHHFWLVDHQDRTRHAADVVGLTGRSIVFTRTRHGADRVARQMGKLGVDAVALHGGRSQNQRTRALKAFASGRAQALVATDVAARGIHVDDVASVIHFDPPADPKAYLHRSGRTARAGATGTVVSLVTGQQRRAVRRLQRDLDLDGSIEAPRLDAIDTGPVHVADTARAGRRRDEQRAPGARPSSRERRTTAKPESIYVSNLPWATTDADLETLFSRHGRVHQATVITNRHTGRSKGFGFVDMAPTAAKKAIDALHDTKMRGRNLTVRFAKPRRYGA